jgi:hypothetical protein
VKNFKERKMVEKLINFNDNIDECIKFIHDCQKDKAPEIIRNFNKGLLGTPNQHEDNNEKLSNLSKNTHDSTKE